MLLYHYTLKRLLPSIKSTGLLCSRSRGAKKAVWLVRSRLGAWACGHVLRKRMGGVEDIVCIAVDVPRSWCKKGHPGMVYVEKDIAPERFRAITGFTVEELEV